MHFLTKVMDAMGSNIHFVIDAATEGGNLTASVIWHLGNFHNLNHLKFDCVTVCRIWCYVLNNLVMFESTKLKHD